MESFIIMLGNRQINAVKTGAACFKVYMHDRVVEVMLKEDNEGANHWFDMAIDSETTESRELGKAIEAYFAENNTVDYNK
ncbi:MAG TPA: hypothetical protein VHB48_09965 [Chitinophagaceae bacterium]|nr:hypothetical protein [Chitinophagaceae bacterium]